VANIRWLLVPNPEWVLMYRRGLTRGQISEQTGAPISTVGYHLAAARTDDPTLREEHYAAANGNPARATRRSVQRMNDLVSMVQQTGRYPASNASEVSERSLAAWLRRRRRDAAEGSLTRMLDDGLSVLPDWMNSPRA
jgi:DNA-binding transcriptional ArsR family regulator